MRINGKIFVPAFAVFIALFLTFVWTIFARHAAIGEVIKEERSAWPRTADVLKRQFDSHNNDAQLNHDIASLWFEAKRQFEDSSIYDNQVPPTKRLCSLLNVKLISDLAPVKFDDSEIETLRSFIALDQHRQALESDLLGTITSKVLVLNYPPAVYPDLVDLLAKRVKE